MRASGLPSRPRTKRLVVLGALVVLGVAVVVFAFQAARATLALREARAQATLAQDQLSDGDLTSARRSLDQLGDSSATARRASDGLLWSAASTLPVVGRNFEAVRLIAAALDGVASESLPAGLEVLTAAQKGTLQAEDGRVNLAEVDRVSPALVRAADRVQKENRQLAVIEPGRLLSPLRKPAADLLVRFAELDRTVGSAASVVKVLPSMLGGEGPRNYVLVAQNTAELRATGGLPGSLSIISARDGKLQQGFQGSAGDFPGLSSPVLPLSAEEEALFGRPLGLDIRQTNLTPDFPRAAELMAAMVTRERGIKVDGVVSVDPIALSTILKVTGPVRAGGESFTGDNVVPKVLNEAYQRFPTQDEQNAYFAGVSRGVFDAVITERADLRGLFSGLTTAVSDRRLLVWSSHEAEQRVLQGSKIAGRLPRDTGNVAQVGMYLNDYSAAKINYYLDYGGQLASVRCDDDGRQTLVARMLLSSSVPRPVSQLSESVTGLGELAPKGANSLALVFYAPAGGKVTALSVNGESTDRRVRTHHGREVTQVLLRVDPGEKVEVLVSLKTAAGQDGNPVLQWTPGMRREPTEFGAKSSCT